eukprot:365776-Chlamydomonas_euryale.AAC.20
MNLGFQAAEAQRMLPLGRPAGCLNAGAQSAAGTCGCIPESSAMVLHASRACRPTPCQHAVSCYSQHINAD